MQNIYPWQQNQWSHITALLSQNRLPHALLLKGSKHLGKYGFALALMERLLCSGEEQQACGNCQGCHLLQSQSHPDFYLIEPLEKSKIIKIEQIRALLTVLSQTSQQGGAQVVIISPAETLNNAAANALLKTLEEPQGNVVFLLVSHQPSNVPATIRSRCQSISFPVPDLSISTAWLQAQNIPDAYQAEMLLKLAEHAPLAALALAQNEQLQTHDKVVTNFLDMRLLNTSPLQAATVMLDVIPEDTFNTLWLVLMDIIRLKTKVSHQAIANIQYSDKLNSISQQISEHKIFKFIDELIEFKKKVDSKITLNQQLLLEDLFVKWKAIEAV